MEEYYEGNCDICMKPDNSHEHNLQQCKECKLLVHELCYGLSPTTTKNEDFICHACKAFNIEIEVNGISRIGGINFKDLILSKDGRISLKEFISKQQLDAAAKSDDTVGEKINQSTYLVCEKLLNFYIAITDFESSKDDDDEDDTIDKKPSLEDEMFNITLKEQAQQIFDTYCAKDAEHKVDLPSNILSKIDDTIYNNEHDITSTLFNDAKKHIYKELEGTSDLFTRYRKSTFYSSFLASQRAIMKQIDRPSECALCSVSTGLHAMHPLYDTHGKDGRQYVIPATVAPVKKERRLAWCHTLCAMSLCTKGYVYGCDSNGMFEMTSDDGGEKEEDRKEKARSNKVIGDDTDSEDEEDGANLEDEQVKFTNCEAIFNPLMKRLQEVANSNLELLVLQCINSMIEYVEVLTPSYINCYPIVKLIKAVKKKFKNNPEVSTKYEELKDEMNRVNTDKKKSVPKEFVPVKIVVFADPDGNEKTDDTSSQRIKTGTSLSKTFHDKNFNGIVTEYNEGSEKPYRVVYTDGKYEDMTESEVSDLVNNKFLSTAFFCINEGTHYLESLSEGEEASDKIKKLRDLQCVICKKTSKSTIKIPVQCSAGDDTEFAAFRKFHIQLKKKRERAKITGSNEGTQCEKAMHVGCARWGASEKYVKNSTNNKSLRMCYYFPGRPPTYTGEDTFDEPLSNCFCRIHAKEIMDGLPTDKGFDIVDESIDNYKKEEKKKAATPTKKRKYEHESDSEEEEKIAARINKRKRLMEESDESD